MTLATRLNTRVLLQQQGGGQDGAGQPSAGWTNVLPGDGKVAAEVRDVSGRQFVTAGATRNSVTSTITIRYRAGVRADMRIVHGADTYNIEAVLRPDARALALMCSKVI